MDIWQMKYFIQMYNDKNLSKAAKNLFISQQALSKALKKMETELQILLFERMANGLKPTKYADILFVRSKKIVYEFDEMMKVLQNQRNSVPHTFAIGISHFLYIDKILEIGQEFTERHPEIIFEIQELSHSACEASLKDGKLDICFSLKPDHIEDFEFIPIEICNMKILINKNNSLSHKAALNMIELKNESFIMLPSDFKLRKLIIDACQEAGFYPDISISSSQLDIIVGLVASNKGIAIIPDCIEMKALSYGDNLCTIPFQDNDFQVEVGLMIYKGKKSNELTRSLINHIFSKYINI